MVEQHLSGAARGKSTRNVRSYRVDTARTSLIGDKYHKHPYTTEQSIDTFLREPIAIQKFLTYKQLVLIDLSLYSAVAYRCDLAK